MGRGRPRTAIGTFGDFAYVTAPNGKVKARVRFRDDDGQLRLVQVTGDSRKSAERGLKAKLSQRESHASGYGALSADSSFRTLVKVWLDDLDLGGKLAPSTRALYERNMRQLVMPAFEHYTLREISVRKVDQFIKTLAATKSYSMAKQARTVLSQGMNSPEHSVVEVELFFDRQHPASTYYRTPGGVLQACFETAGKGDSVVTHRPIQGKPRLSGAHEPSPPDPAARPV